MSVQFGRWNFDGRPAGREYLAKAEGILAPYGPDGGDTYIKDSVGILFRAFHTTKESRTESQPLVTPSGAVLTWDGRLDNRAELILELRAILATALTDVSIVAAAYEWWGTDCFAKLIGDWALSIWNPRERSLILAKDPVGTRHLYYSFEKEQVSWSTILDPLVLLAGKTFAFEEEYIAGWLSFFPATHLTPYVGIHSVPPSTSVLIRAGKHTVSKYWDFDPGKRIRYRTDGEYEEHFRAVFAEAVRRRLRADSPILAELSGGMDSSSIVCMADSIIAEGVAEAPRVDTLSTFDDSEPNWNESAFFAKVEEKRGRVGCHIDCSSHESFMLWAKSDRFVCAPGAADRSDHSAKRYAECILTQGNRVVLSGIGGDEVMGGVPTPTPEIEDLLSRARFQTLGHQLKAWALAKRKPWFHLLGESAKGFLPSRLAPVPRHKGPAVWLTPQFVSRNLAALLGYEARITVLGPLPSFQENINTLNALRRQIGCTSLMLQPPREKRYPCLDRSLLEFLYAIPREQVVRPGQRRSLMRRALSGIVPREVLNRKRKSVVVRAPRIAISQEWGALLEMTQDMLTDSLGIVDSGSILQALQETRNGHEVDLIKLMRTLGIERWLRNLNTRGVLRHAGCTERPSNSFQSRWRNRKQAGTCASISLSDDGTQRANQLRPSAAAVSAEKIQGERR